MTDAECEQLKQGGSGGGAALGTSSRTKSTPSKSAAPARRTKLLPSHSFTCKIAEGTPVTDKRDYRIETRTWFGSGQYCRAHQRCNSRTPQQV